MARLPVTQSVGWITQFVRWRGVPAPPDLRGRPGVVLRPPDERLSPAQGPDKPHVGVVRGGRVARCGRRRVRAMTQTPIYDEVRRTFGRADRTLQRRSFRDEDGAAPERGS